MEIEKSQVKSVAKAIHLLDILAKERQSLSLLELSQRTGWPKSTIHALLSTMMDYSVIAQDNQDGKYHLGMHLFELGNVVTGTWNALEVARPYLQHIMLKTEESVNLGVMDRDEILVIEHIDSGNPLRVMIERGTRLPMHCTAMGKVLLASIPPSQAKRIIKNVPLQAYTPHTIVSVSDLEAELDKIRNDGYAIENGEMRVGMRAVAAPVYDVRGSAVYAIGITGMFRRISDDVFLSARDLVVNAAFGISKVLGFKQQSA